MKIFIKLILLTTFLYSCNNEVEMPSNQNLNWEHRKISLAEQDILVFGKTYLPVYSHIYHRYEHKTFDLTITISIRNISSNDSVYILKADYYNTEGEKIRKYLQEPVYLKPMETIEIIIEEEDKEGGSGANFLFNWAAKNEKNPPLFEAVMISTYGQQGLSFTTRGVQLIE